MARLDKVKEHAEKEARRMERAKLLPTRRERTSALLADREALADLLEHIASGGRLRAFCDEHVYSYSTVQAALTKREDLAPLYDAALDARSDLQREQIEKLTKQVISGELDPKAAKVAIESLQWLAEKMNPRRYGQRQQVDVQVTDMTKLHLEAVRQLALKPRPVAIDAVAIKPGEYSALGAPSEAPSK